MAPSSHFKLPGFNLPMNWVPSDKPTGKASDLSPDWEGEGRSLFPCALDADSSTRSCQRALTTLREFTILDIMNSITDKEGWDSKVFDKTITDKWKQEALGTEGRDVSEHMAQYAIDELKYKARIFKETGAVSILNGDVVKSDSAIPESLKEELKAAVKRLENVPDRYKDWHPGSDGKVLDLVHPSLFPLVYGRTRILENELVGLEECIESSGKGVTLPVPPVEDSYFRDLQESRYGGTPSRSTFSQKFQWLPCDVDLLEDGQGVKITSYINNLHPKQYKSLYGVVEKIIARAIPLWNLTLSPLTVDYAGIQQRIRYYTVKYDPDPDSMEWEKYPGILPNENEDDYSDRRWEWEVQFRGGHTVQPEPDDFQDLGDDELDSSNSVDLSRDYSHRGLQIIVKFANIHLTPENPTYEGGTWHCEGQHNEHICATALYYYDNENISTSRLAFRHQVDGDTIDIGYAQNDEAWFLPVFGCTNNSPGVQEIGSVLCRENRLVTFPNILQHRVAPFSLADPTKPGHRKILALFLVDPNIRIISTANVPPQQRDWWRDEVESTGVLQKLSAELKEKVIDGVDDFPISMDDAKVLREELMEERSRWVASNSENFLSTEFSLCEH